MALLWLMKHILIFLKKQSAIELINEFENILVLQTFSKAWGLAALRVGVAYSNP
jgi:histidinol-phosphate aminotransferase